MRKLTENMKRIVEKQKLGYVASVCADGSPNLSPKGTFLVLDDTHIMFGEMRSPNTVKNIASNSTIEVNFVDLFSRKGFRCKGHARFVRKSTAEFSTLQPRFQEQWGDELCALFNGIVIIKVENASPLVSPAYDIGANESDLCQHWLAYFSSL